MLVLSLLLHALFWWLAPKAPLVPPSSTAPVDTFTVVEKPKPKPAPKPKPPAQAHRKAKPPPQPLVKQPPPPPRMTTPQEIDRAYVEHPSNKPKPLSPQTEHVTKNQAQTPAPGHAAVEGGTPLGSPNAGGRHEGSSGQVAPGDVKLFDPNAIGMSVHRWEAGQPDPHQYMDSHADGDQDDPLAEQARVGGRIGAQIQEAQTEGRDEGGLQSPCNDGIDQGEDGYMDCADPGCRQMPVCANTSEYSKVVDRTIPDGSTVGVTSEIEVPEGGSIRTMSVQVNVRHGSPGDLSIVIEHIPPGKKMMVLRANRNNRFFHRAYLLKDFIGGESAGTWRITVRDVFAGTEGSLKSWRLFITR